MLVKAATVLSIIFFSSLQNMGVYVFIWTIRALGDPEGIFSLIWVWINDWVNNRKAGDLRRYRAHYDVTVMMQPDNGMGRLFWTDFAKCHFHVPYFLFNPSAILVQQFDCALWKISGESVD